MCCLGYVGLWLCFFAGADFGLHAIVGSGFDFLCLLFLGFLVCDCSGGSLGTLLFVCFGDLAALYLWLM